MLRPQPHPGDNILPRVAKLRGYVGVCMLVKICLKIVKIVEELPLLAFLSASAHSLSGYCIHISPAMSSAHPGSLAVFSTYRDNDNVEDQGKQFPI